ncbi:hypothetical protein JVU11DRAFT_9045 [Chiua virens]|nr:hypothetical protein JVU11DRAFT_9045 [Chiua virens]
MDAKLTRKLDILKHYLSHLPDTSPLSEPGQSTYNFESLEASPEDIEDYGETGAINRQLEIIFGSRHNGPIVFVECGPRLVGVVKVLHTYLLKDPGSAILQKWVEDLTTSATLHFVCSGIPLPDSPVQATVTSTISTNVATGKKAMQKLDSKKMSSSHDPDYVDIPEPEDNRKGGAKTLPLLREIAIYCHPKDNPGTKRRILDHGSKCTYLDHKLRDAAIEVMADKAPGPKAIIPGAEVSSTLLSPAIAMASASSSTVIGSVATEKMMMKFVSEGKKASKERGDYALMKFFVCCGIPPSIADTVEFKDMVSTLSSTYSPPSATTLEDKLIANEGAKITLAVATYLKTCHNLTITFDGGKICRPKSLYTIHVTTAGRRSFCMELDDASLLSHTADYILEALEQVNVNITNMELDIDTTIY